MLCLLRYTSYSCVINIKIVVKMNVLSKRKNIKIVHRLMKYDKVCRRLMYLLKVAVCSAYDMFTVQTDNAVHNRHYRILPLKKKLSEVLCNYVQPKTLDKLSVNIDHV